VQVVVDRKTRQVLCVAIGRGREHDFHLYKRSGLVIHQASELLADKGYQGMHKLHAKSRTPKRKPPRKALSPEDRAGNRAIARLRMVVEHVIRRLKVFRILAGPYRNRRKRLGLRVNLIAAIYNLDGAKKS
jgi:transposase